MPNFLCKNCGAINLVPTNELRFTCKNCGVEQPTPPFEEQIENDSLLDSFLDAPDEPEKVDNSVLNSVFDSPDKKQNISSEVFKKMTFSENVKVYENDFKDEKRDEANKKNGIYYTALSKMGGEDPKLYREALSAFEAIKGWRDSEKLIEECKKSISKLEKREERLYLETQKKEKRRKQMFAIGIPFTTLVVIGILVSLFVIIPNSRYSKAVNFEKNGDVISAYEGFSSLNGYKDSEQKANELFDEYKQNKIYYANIGDIVYFGSYEQDAVKSDGSEDIMWKVLDKDKNSVLLLSLYGLDSLEYNTKNEEVTWETSSIRKWLNADFYDTAFSEQQKKRVITSTVTADKNPDYETYPGNDTNDKVFLLSIVEVKNYLKTKEDFLCGSTDYTVSRHANISSTKSAGKNTSSWFLRTPGFDNTLASYVTSDGIIRNVGFPVDRSLSSIRPAIRVNISPEND